MNQATDQQPQFQIEKIYVKDISLEVPNAPQIFLDREPPQVNVELHTDSASVSDGIYQASVTVTVTAKIKDRTVFLVEATQAGIFTLRNIPEGDIKAVLGVACPNIIFPYLRETVSDAITRAGFPPVLLAPVNFDLLFQQQSAQVEAPAAGSAATTH
jgi:preprotein translocase subunit SecB